MKNILTTLTLIIGLTACEEGNGASFVTTNSSQQVKIRIDSSIPTQVHDLLRRAVNDVPNLGNITHLNISSRAYYNGKGLLIGNLGIHKLKLSTTLQTPEMLVFQTYRLVSGWYVQRSGRFQAKEALLEVEKLGLDPYVVIEELRKTDLPSLGEGAQSDWDLANYLESVLKDRT